ncbi:MAG: winged helix DNA-binding protein, partial [Lachnospiraceae bacterium]|nr:winged helix DNA-binding protein [Lachnospiraceae bacterium]
ESVNEKDLVDALNLKSNTLAPLLKKLKEKGYISIVKDKTDKRSIDINITAKGIRLKDKAIDIPKVFGKSFPLDEEELKTYRKLIYKLMNWEIKND